MFVQKQTRKEMVKDHALIQECEMKLQVCRTLGDFASLNWTKAALFLMISTA